MLLDDHPPAAITAPRMQRVRGEGRLAVRRRGAGTQLHRLHQEGAAKIRLPRRTEHDDLEAVLINTAGGLTGGDRLRWRIDAEAGARAVVTTQACEKIYRSSEGPAEVEVSLGVGPGASIAWLPQETILFDRSRLHRRLGAELAADGTLLVLEATLLGRAAMGEVVRTGRFRDRWRIRREGRLVHAEDLLLDGDITEVTARAAALAGATAFASFLLVAPDTIQRLEPARRALGEQGGASCFDGRLTGRVAAADGLALRRILLPLIAALRPGAPLPRVWTL
jgi:urease accessory protein